MRLLVAAALVLGAPSASAERAPAWKVDVPERVDLVAGASGTLPVAITLDRGKTVSRDGGVILDLAPDSAIAIKRRRLGLHDAVDPGADAPRFAVALRAEIAGDYRVRVRLRFWVCGQNVCRPADVRRNVLISVTAPTPAPQAP